jgi:hypothetical protein
LCSERHSLCPCGGPRECDGAAKNPAGEAKTGSLRDFPSERVPEMAKAIKREQEPLYFRGRDRRIIYCQLGSEAGGR